MTCWTTRSTILQNFIALCQPTPEISVTKILRTKKKQTSTPVNPTGVYPHMPIAVTAPFVTLTFNLSRSFKVKPVGPTSQLLPFFTYLTSKRLTLIFDPQGHPRSKVTAPIESPWVLRISAPEVERRICHRFRNISTQNFDC